MISRSQRYQYATPVKTDTVCGDGNWATDVMTGPGAFGPVTSCTAGGRCCEGERQLNVEIGYIIFVDSRASVERARCSPGQFRGIAGTRHWHGQLALLGQHTQGNRENDTEMGDSGMTSLLNKAYFVRTKRLASPQRRSCNGMLVEGGWKNSRIHGERRRISSRGTS